MAKRNVKKAIARWTSSALHAWSKSKWYFRNSSHFRQQWLLGILNNEKPSHGTCWNWVLSLSQVDVWAEFLARYCFSPYCLWLWHAESWVASFISVWVITIAVDSCPSTCTTSKNVANSRSIIFCRVKTAFGRGVFTLFPLEDEGNNTLWYPYFL